MPPRENGAPPKGPNEEWHTDLVAQTFRFMAAEYRNGSAIE
jgi:hypothetical protein